MVGLGTTVRVVTGDGGWGGPSLPPRTGLELLDALAGDARIATGHRCHAVRAQLLELAGDPNAARTALSGGGPAYHQPPAPALPARPGRPPHESEGDVRSALV